MCKVLNLIKLLLLLLSCIAVIYATPTTITAPPLSADNLIVEKDDVKNIFRHCLHKSNVSQCFKQRIISILDDVIRNDDPWSLNFFNINLSLSKNPSFNDDETTTATATAAAAAANTPTDRSRSFEDIISQRVKNLLESRVFQIKLAAPAAATADESNMSDEARKKKEGKHGHMMMMSGEFC